MGERGVFLEEEKEEKKTKRERVRTISAFLGLVDRENQPKRQH